jgi:hypothetical protein
MRCGRTVHARRFCVFLLLLRLKYSICKIIVRLFECVAEMDGGSTMDVEWVREFL